MIGNDFPGMPLCSMSGYWWNSPMTTFPMLKTIFGSMTCIVQAAQAALRTKLFDAMTWEHEATPDMTGVEDKRLRSMVYA
jgi:hypothetical protein